MTVLLAAVAVAETGFLMVWLATAGHPTTEVADVLIALSSLAMGIQTAAVRSLGVQGIFTTAGTFTLVAFTGTFAGSRLRSEMPRLVGVLLGLIARAVAGGLLFLHVRSCAPALPLASTVLVILAGQTMHRSGPALGETQCHHPSIGRAPVSDTGFGSRSVRSGGAQC
jgi:uncharacterized membrane protein YoaK (UPF0700 family)